MTGQGENGQGGGPDPLAVFDGSATPTPSPPEGLLAAIVENASAVIIAKRLDGTIAVWNPAAEEVFGYSAEEIVGRNIRLLIPEGREHEEDAIIARIGAGEKVAPFRTRRLHKSGHEIDVMVSVSPVRDSDGNVVGASKLARPIGELELAQLALMQSERRFQMLADNISQLAWIADNKGWIYWYNQRWFDYTGTTLEDMQGWGWKAVHHPDHVDRVVEKIQHSWDSGEVWEDTFPLRGADGKYRWFLSRARPMRGEDGKIEAWFGTNTDITEQREQRQSIEVLLREVNHRAKNMLTLIMALARRSAPGNEAFLKRFVRRIQALAANQDLLVKQAWRSVTMRDLVEAQLAFAMDRVQDGLHHQGPAIDITARTAETLGLALHELATNALKYGALSQGGEPGGEGRVDIEWSVENGRFRASWTESGGPQVTAPERSGFGTSVIRDIPAATLEAEVTLEFPPEGLRWTIDAPAENILAE